VDNSCGLRFMRVRAPARARVQARVWRGCGCGCGVGADAGVAWMRLGGGLGSGFRELGPRSGLRAWG
jgi:hypothetical protein